MVHFYAMFGVNLGRRYWPVIVDIIQLIYVSTATHLMNEGEIQGISDSSGWRNAQQGFTGILVYSHGNFMQVLEGNRGAVDETMCRIAADARHHSIYVLSDEMIPEREFGRWLAAYRGATTQDSTPWTHQAPFFAVGCKPEEMGARQGRAWKLLRLFVEHNL